MRVFACNGISVLVRYNRVNKQNINGFAADWCNRCEACCGLCGWCTEFKHGVQACDVGLVHKVGKEKFGLTQELCELTNAHLRKVLRTQSGTFPKVCVHRCEGELLAKELIFIQQCLFLRIRSGVSGEQPRLSEKNGCNLEETVSVLLQAGEWRLQGKGLEGYAIGVKAEVVRQGDIESMCPTLLRDGQQLVDRLPFTFQTFDEQCLAPPLGDECGVTEQLPAAFDGAKGRINLRGGL